MAIDTIAGRLTAHDIFRDLPPETVELIAREAERTIYRDGQAITVAGAEGDGAIVIVAGRARIVPGPDTHTPSLPSSIEAGTMIGEMAMLTEHTHSFDIVADGDVRAIKIPRSWMHELMASDRALLEHFQDRVVARLSRLVLELKLVDERLAIAGALADEAA